MTQQQEPTEKIFKDGKWEGEGFLPTTLSDAEIAWYEEKAAALAVKKSVSKVHVVVLMERGTFERKVCFLQEPLYLAKVRIMDKASTVGAYTAAEELRSLCTLQEDSDAITFGPGPECDEYKLGVTDYCLGMITRLQNQFKKK